MSLKHCIWSICILEEENGYDTTKLCKTLLLKNYFSPLLLHYKLCHATQRKFMVQRIALALFKFCFLQLACDGLFKVPNYKINNSNCVKNSICIVVVDLLCKMILLLFEDYHIGYGIIVLKLVDVLFHITFISRT